eukprot:GFYU01011784.1.p1 GENE.GFYU01011784.1~~GFYU01011784.1.p1  ORF type:complete len:111 (-),score=20.98 GFYU01011784.1:120-452(-)
MPYVKPEVTGYKGHITGNSDIVGRNTFLYDPFACPRPEFQPTPIPPKAKIIPPVVENPLALTENDTTWSRSIEKMMKEDAVVLPEHFKSTIQKDFGDKPGLRTFDKALGF